LENSPLIIKNPKSQWNILISSKKEKDSTDSLSSKNNGPRMLGQTLFNF
jgi:hypothetical protein